MPLVFAAVFAVFFSSLRYDPLSHKEPALWSIAPNDER